MTAYSQYRLARTTIDRNRELNAQKLITPKDFQEVNANYEVAQATYQGLMDEIGFEAQLDNTRADQAEPRPRPAQRSARERLRILGVKSDGTEPAVEGVKWSESSRTAHSSHRGATKSSPTVDQRGGHPAARPDRKKVAVKPVGAVSIRSPFARDTPVSTYSIWAPFDGTILDREMIVPGGPSTRLTASSRWPTSPRSGSRRASTRGISTCWTGPEPGGKVHFRSPAYPDRVFEGQVIYSGDLVDEQSRSVKLLAQAENPEWPAQAGHVHRGRGSQSR